MSSVLFDSLDYSMSTGSSIRVKECNTCLGQGRSMAVQITRKEDGFLWHCFRCHKSGFFPDQGASPQQVQELTANANKKKVDNRPDVVVLPADFTTTIPPKGLVQLYDLGIEESDLLWFDLGWSASHARIIVPIYKYSKGQPSGDWSKQLIGVVGRKLEDSPESKPKWWSQRQKDIKHPRFIGMPTEILYPRQVVICEDVFSAIRISTTGRMALALLTTYLPYELYPVLQGWDVRLWLDEDAHGKATKYQSSLGTNAITAQVILTSKDPKEYTNEEINHHIKLGDKI
ncbi:MAG: hypothetical protein JRE23_03270 [Deltaproteobacteria bacterium]|nr:hypothetical protein [Deltaproteobacteria bacterium]